MDLVVAGKGQKSTLSPIHNWWNQQYMFLSPPQKHWIFITDRSRTSGKLWWMALYCSTSPIVHCSRVCMLGFRIRPRLWRCFPVTRVILSAQIMWAQLIWLISCHFRNLRCWQPLYSPHHSFFIHWFSLQHLKTPHFKIWLLLLCSLTYCSVLHRLVCWVSEIIFRWD